MFLLKISLLLVVNTSPLTEFWILQTRTISKFMNQAMPIKLCCLNTSRTTSKPNPSLNPHPRPRPRRSHCLPQRRRRLNRLPRSHLRRRVPAGREEGTVPNLRRAPRVCQPPRRHRLRGRRRRSRASTNQTQRMDPRQSKSIGTQPTFTLI